LNIDISEEAGVRYLHFGSSWIQGAMRIARPYALELDYTREMMTPLLLHEPDWPRKVLQIGLGAASVTKFLWRYRPQARSPWSRSNRASPPPRGSSSSCPTTRRASTSATATAPTSWSRRNSAST
jgi:hypothetical protein